MYIANRRSRLRPFAHASRPVLHDTKRHNDDGRADSLGLEGHHPLRDAENASSFNIFRTRFRKLSDRSVVAANDFTAKAASSFSLVGLHLNRITGYEEIEALKRQVVEQEARIVTTRRIAREAKQAYDQAVVHRSNSQREVNDLLQRKPNWTGSDLDRFMNLVRQDHALVQEEMRAKATVSTADDAVDREFSQLMQTILARYHEEQVWSDKIRSASTYGSLVALGLNMVVFIMAIIVVEPWKRRRLAQTFEKKIDEMSGENTAMVESGMKNLATHFVRQEELLSEMIEALSKSSNSHTLESADEVPTSTVERIVRAVKGRHVTTAFATSTITAAVIGWVAHIWLGF